jgi:hypothetical protein
MHRGIDYSYYYKDRKEKTRGEVDEEKKKRE